LALVMAMAGRPVCLDELDGDGVAVLRERQALGPAQLRALARSR
jgi:hypothetical protein